MTDYKKRHILYSSIDEKLEKIQASLYWKKYTGNWGKGYEKNSENDYVYYLKCGKDLTYMHIC